jgi:trehalose-phosphatase
MVFSEMEKPSALLALSKLQDHFIRKHVFLFLDFDGTLAPIVSDPFAASLPARTRALLTELHLRPDVTIAVISGRAISDLRACVGLDVIYSGNHGLEIEGSLGGSNRSIEYRNETAESAASALAALSREIQSVVAGIPGVILDNKVLTLSVHYRNVADVDLPEFFDLVEQKTAAVSDVFVLNFGKMVLEIRPKTGWNKGTAATFLLQHLKSLDRQPADIFPIAMGDDATDEDMFAALTGGMNICVSPVEALNRVSLADYRLADASEVADFLEALLQLRRA